MLRIASLLLLYSHSLLQCISGVMNPEPMQIPALIEVKHHTGYSWGSGVYLSLSNSVYLVTAKHVLFASAEGTNPPALLGSEATVVSYSDANATNTSKRVIRVNLQELFRRNEIRFSADRDVALIRIQDRGSSSFTNLVGVAYGSSVQGLQTLTAEALIRIDKGMVGADVFMYGYPISITGPLSGLLDPSEPLLRKGIIAGVDTIRGRVIVDCPAYQGNSGGPVLQLIDGRNLKVIGIVSALLPFEEKWENKTMRYSHVLKSNSGYTVIEPIGLALDLVWK